MHMYVYMYMHGRYARMSVCVHAWKDVCHVCVYVYVCVYTHICDCARACVCGYVYVMCICTCVHRYVCMYVSTSMCLCTYIHICANPPPQLTRTTSECVSPIFESTVGEVLFAQHQPSTFVDADIRNISVPLTAVHLRA